MLAFAQLPTPLPPPLPEIRVLGREKGDRISIDRQTIASPWAWTSEADGQPPRLWLTLELLENRFGLRRDGDQLVWFGREQALSSLARQSLGDEVALDAMPWLNAVGIRPQRSGPQLEVALPAPTLQRMRRGTGHRADRLVLDLDGPLLIQRIGNDLSLELQTSREQFRALRRLNLGAVRRGSNLRLRGQATRLRTLSLANPWRLVLDGVRPAQPRSNRPPDQPLPLTHPQIAPLIRRGFVLDRLQLKVGVKPLEIWRAGGPLQSLGLTLEPLAQTGSQQGLRFLPQLAPSSRVIAAVNGGFFNRINQLPLGAVRQNSTWLSGPILNRGAIGWSRGETPLFGRLSLRQTLHGPGRQIWRLSHLNSGYIQRGYSRYTTAWGPLYRALSGQETAVLIHNGRVIRQVDHAQLTRGIPLPPAHELIVARGGLDLPLQPGDRTEVRERVNDPLGRLPNVLGGGPLLLQRGQVVLNGRAEGFSPDFLSVRAPRTVVGQGPSGTWVVTIRGSTGSDPTLLETALAAQQLNLHEALNLDGGSSTTLVVAGRAVMNGRGSPPRVHNGLGFGPL
ncbi:MAG: phosphodiester glycosidase family protein [Synechococcus sp.]